LSFNDAKFLQEISGEFLARGQGESVRDFITVDSEDAAEFRRWVGFEHLASEVLGLIGENAQGYRGLERVAPSIFWGMDSTIECATDSIFVAKSPRFLPPRGESFRMLVALLTPPTQSSLRNAQRDCRAINIACIEVDGSKRYEFILVGVDSLAVVLFAVPSCKLFDFFGTQEVYAKIYSS